jgi:hypothetical protein
VPDRREPPAPPGSAPPAVSPHARSASEALDLELAALEATLPPQRPTRGTAPDVPHPARPSEPRTPEHP